MCVELLLVGVIGSIIWLGLSVRRQFEHHDRDLRAEVELVNAQMRALIAGLTKDEDEPTLPVA